MQLIQIVALPFVPPFLFEFLEIRFLRGFAPICNNNCGGQTTNNSRAIFMPGLIFFPSKFMHCYFGSIGLSKSCIHFLFSIRRYSRISPKYFFSRMFFRYSDISLHSFGISLCFSSYSPPPPQKPDLGQLGSVPVDFAEPTNQPPGGVPPGAALVARLSGGGGERCSGDMPAREPQGIRGWSAVGCRQKEPMSA